MLWPCAAHLHAKLANAITGRLTNFAVLQFQHFSGAGDQFQKHLHTLANFAKLLPKQDSRARR